MASVDLPRFGRLLPGQTVRFAAIDVAEAEMLRREQRHASPARSRASNPARPPGGIDLVKLYEENLIDGVVF